MFVKRVVLIIAVMLFAASCDSSVSADRKKAPTPDGRTADDFVSAEKLDAQFKSDNEEAIISAIQKSTRIWTDPADMKVYGLLLDAWNQKEELHPAYNWKLLRSPRVKITLASELVQSYRNGRIPLSLGEFRNFALEQINASQSSTTGPAIVLLGEVGEVGDVPLLEKLAVGGDSKPAYFQESVLALNHVCGNEAEVALKRLRDQASGDKRDFADGALKSRKQFLQGICH